MNFLEYQGEVIRTGNFNGTDAEVVSNMCMGISGEVGETVNYIKKSVYQGHELSRDKIKEELGDTLWYLIALASYYNISLDDIVEYNVKKLRKRYPEGYSQERSLNRED
jgi:NTP pyrophosphatase (non-canonical NTP hydrolase)